MDIRWRIRSRPNASRAVVTLVSSIAEETIESEKPARSMRRRLLSVDLLKTNDVGRKIIQDRPENSHPTHEFRFMRSGPIKIFDIECRKAKRNGHHQIIAILSANPNDANSAVRPLKSGQFDTLAKLGPFVENLYPLLWKVLKLGAAFTSRLRAWRIHSV